jgi:4-aminobutyrate aminotransferase-like enzyme
VGVAGEHVVRLLPPLIAQEPEIDEAVSILDRIFGKLASG